MTKTVLLLMCLILIFSVDAEDTVESTRFRRPACGGISLSQACPLNYAPVCGSDGITYANECALCVQCLQTNADIMIRKDGSC